MSIDDMYKSEQKEKIMKKTYTKSNCHDWLINYIPQLIKTTKTVGVVQNKVMSLFKKTQPRLIVNQHVSKICMVVEKKQGN